jgi:hypothetical protein
VHMNTEELLRSLQLWLRAGVERTPDTREDGCGGEVPIEGTGGDHHEINHPKCPAEGQSE